jgi:hypothetical protein
MMNVKSLTKPMLRLKFNRPFVQKRCPVCNLTTGRMVGQREELQKLGYFGASDAHLICVEDEKERRQ